MKPAVAIDAEATEHTLSRQGVGGLKHMDGACVWSQDEDGFKRLRVCRVKE